MRLSTLSLVLWIGGSPLGSEAARSIVDVAAALESLDELLRSRTADEGHRQQALERHAEGLSQRPLLRHGLTPAMRRAALPTTEPQTPMERPRLTSAQVDALADRVVREAQVELSGRPVNELERKESLTYLIPGVGQAKMVGDAVNSVNPLAKMQIGYKAKKAILGSTKYNMLKIASTALYMAMSMEDHDGGIPPENKMALVTRIATIRTDSKARGLSSLMMLEREAPESGAGPGAKPGPMNQRTAASSDEGEALGEEKHTEDARLQTGGASGLERRAKSGKRPKKNSADGDVGYAITSTLLGQSKKQLQTIAYNAISVAQLLKDEDTGIPPENKVSLAARIAALRTDENARNLFTVSSDPMLAGGFLLMTKV